RVVRARHVQRVIRKNGDQPVGKASTEERQGKRHNRDEPLMLVLPDQRRGGFRRSTALSWASSLRRSSDTPASVSSMIDQAHVGSASAASPAPSRRCTVAWSRNPVGDTLSAYVISSDQPCLTRSRSK